VVPVQAFLAEREEPWAMARALLRATLELDPTAARAVPDRAAQALVDVVPELEELRPIGAGTIDPESRRALTLEGGVRLVEAVASRSLLLLADDIQWADATSLALLRLLAQRVRGLGLILAFRNGADSPGSPLASLLREVRGIVDGGGVALSLEPLPPAAIRALVDDEELAAAISNETDGTPLAVAEVIRSLAGDGAIEPGPGGHWRARIPTAAELAVHSARSGQRRAMRERIDHQPSGRKEVLCLLALTGRELPARVLAAAAGREQEHILEDVDALASAGLVRLGERGWGIAHDVIAEAVTEALEAPRRGRLHATLARALSAEGADHDEIARHLAAAGDVASAADALARAARDRLDFFANSEAERLAVTGLELNPTMPLRSELLEVRAEARARSGDLSGAREHLRRALEGAERGRARSRILARMAMLASGAEDLAHARELGELAIVEAGHDPVARAGAVSVGAILDMNADRPERAQARFDEALGLYEELGDARGVAGILDGRAMETFLQGNIREAVEAFDRVARLFLDSGDLLRVPTPRSTRGHALIFMGRPEQALRDIAEALELARTLGSPENETYGLWHRSEALAALGRSAEAVESATAALSLAEQLGHREWKAASLRGVGIACEAAGDLDRAEAAYRRSLATAENLSLFTAWACARIALVLIARGDLSSAEAFVDRALAEGPPLSRFEARLARAELVAARGDPDAPAVAAEALLLADSRGHVASATRLAALVGSHRDKT
jgi:tetratricopeptide (TPR) repeat protein